MSKKKAQLIQELKDLVIELKSPNEYYEGDDECAAEYANGIDTGRARVAERIEEILNE